MNPELFEKNIGKLIHQAALLPDVATRERARAEFLLAAQPSPTARSWGLAVTAAALLLAALVYGSLHPGASPAPPSVPSKEPQESPPSYTTLQTSGGNDLLKCVLKTTNGAGFGRKLLFEGRSPLPEGVVFHALIMPGAYRLLKGRLEEDPQGISSIPTRLEAGSFTVECEVPRPGITTVEFRAPDYAQDMAVLKQLKIKEAEREWSFVAYSWDDGLLSRLEPQLAELTQLAAEARDLVARVEAACATTEQFKAAEKEFILAARRIEARAKGLSATGLFPAAVHQIASTAGDLAASMAIFTWKDGKFDGPSSYYTDHKRGKTFRGDLFDFDALRRYLDEAVLVGGREFDLWIANDLRRSGLRPLLIDIVNKSAGRPGVAEFAERLKAGTAPVDEIRQIAK